MNESEKMKDVWKWKEEVHERTKNMTSDERIAFFNKGVEEFSKRTGLKVLDNVQKRQPV